ncbi:hypothetical protein ACFW19_34505, partial [Streptomyces nigra]|uniref:hypothetical protein n=1 Tax=Streptomyces nigra TaxID=1827580 RepID=UPI0036A4EAD4
MKQYVFDALLLGGRSGAFRDGRLSTRERCGAAFLGGAERGKAALAVVATPWADGRLKISECARPGACVSSARAGPASVVRSFGCFGQVGEGGAVDVLGDVQALG